MPLFKETAAMLTPALQLGYTLDFVILTRSAIARQRTETVPDPSVATLWQHADNLLAEFAAAAPEALTCFHEMRTREHERVCGVDFILPDGLALWIGTVTCGGWGADITEATEFDIEPQKDRDAPLAGQAAPDEPTVRRDEYGCVIRVSDEFPTVPALERGIRAYLQRFCPPLAPLPMRWLDEKTSETLAREIKYRLQHTVS